MGQTVDNFKRGTAEMLVLYLLSKEDLYGYQITQAFSEKSDGVYTMLEGSLYPILYRLTEAGYITDYTKQVGKRRTRRYYHLEDAGREYYKEILADYDSVTDSINKILDRIGDDNI
ncbi:MAG: PadR family transcriptional regulator [Eubacterium sp.]|nr:PadR family transcriptional regulator [Eubacterium sp.]